MPHSTGVGLIQGIVAEDGVVKPGAVVRLYDRTTGSLVRQTLSVDDGGYSFSGLNCYTDDYMVLAVDDDGDPKKNALVHDRVQPISAHQGSEFYGNWLVEVRKQRPVLWWSYDIQGGNLLPPLPALYPWGMGTTAGGVAVENNITVPTCPTLVGHKPTAGYAYAYGTVFTKNFLEPAFSTSTWSSGVKFSQFHIALFDAPFSTVVGSRAQDNSYLFYSECTRFSYNGTTLTVQMRNSTTITDWVSYSGTDTRLSLSAHTGNWTTVLTYTVPVDKRSGLHSIAIAWFWGGNSRLYLDGILVSTFSSTVITSLPKLDESVSAWNVFEAIVHGDAAYNYCNGTQAFYADGVFPHQFSDADALALHEGFFVTQLPKVTGYAKECLFQGVRALHIFDDGEATGTHYETFSPPQSDYSNKNTGYPNAGNGIAMNPYGTLVTGKPSPLIGHTATNFTNGAYRGWAGLSLHGRFTQYELIIQRTTTAVPTTETLMELRININGAYNTVERKISLGSDRRFTFFFRAAVNDSIKPLYVLPDNTLVKVYFHWIRTSNRWDLYIDDVWVETGACAADAEAFGPTSLQHEYAHQIGGLVNNSNTTSELFNGDIASLAIFHFSEAHDSAKMVGFRADRAAAMLVP